MNQPCSGKLQWKLLDKGWWKHNVNGAIFPNQCRVGVGCVLWGDHCQVAMVATLPEVHREDHLEIELLVIFRGLQLYVPINFCKLVAEMDCLVAIQTIEEILRSMQVAITSSKRSLP